jgi:hypothetical protein
MKGLASVQSPKMTRYLRLIREAETLPELRLLLRTIADDQIAPSEQLALYDEIIKHRLVILSRVAQRSPLPTQVRRRYDDESNGKTKPS